MLNNINIMGRLTADPELRHTPNGVAVTTFRIAVNRDFKNKDTGEHEADFIQIVCWRNTAEFASRFFTRGQLVIVAGRLQMRDYTDKEGIKRTVAEVIAESVYFGESRRERTPPSDEDLMEAREKKAQQFEDIDEDEGLPF